MGSDDLLPPGSDRGIGVRGCGCYNQLLRNPFYSSLVEHVRLNHPVTLPGVARVQASFLARVAELLVPEHDPPWWALSRPSADGEPDGGVGEAGGANRA
jgi:hypothetical protein